MKKILRFLLFLSFIALVLIGIRYDIFEDLFQSSDKVQSDTSDKQVCKIGDLYPNESDPVGVVFDLDASIDGKSGILIVSLDAKNAYWSNVSSMEHLSLPPNSSNSGYSNRLDFVDWIVRYQKKEDNYPAFMFCENRNSQVDGARAESLSGWWLPSVDEVRNIMIHREKIDSVLVTQPTTHMLLSTSDVDLYLSSTVVGRLYGMLGIVGVLAVSRSSTGEQQQQNVAYNTQSRGMVRCVRFIAN